MPDPSVVAVARDDRHRFSKPTCDVITLVAGHGVLGDAHAGPTVQHRSRVRRDPTQPNLRQVHLIHRELFDEVDADVAPGDLGENVTTTGLALLELPRGTRLHLGPDAIVEVTGLRNPCTQIERHAAGLLAQVVGRDDDGHVVRRTGVMGVVVAGGDVRPGDPIVVALPDGAHEGLEPV
ncbi:MOSC domain-containing protein [Agrococcus sp. SGAir0287]|uniref:MOSC domain-containing protein n=1 Tax=Agrococcus sp. SGAir0287 TaxID=2070347 RepID=UPI0010CD6B9B|nr:MOSC domain-containing protein [Agrococcus sp. SGAir0287]QCR18636.1 MOSC domain-containing protein [Agrococcus sp. SGAir0287]